MMSNEKLTDNAVTELIKKNINDYRNIGYNVTFREGIAPAEWDTITDQTAFDVVTICRRKLKKEDILVLSITEGYVDEEISSGIIFTKDKICEFDDDALYNIIKYTDIKEVDYDTESVKITTDAKTHTLICCCDEDREDASYSKYMYNFIMDIVDYLQENE